MAWFILLTLVYWQLTWWDVHLTVLFIFSISYWIQTSGTRWKWHDLFDWNWVVYCRSTLSLRLYNPFHISVSCWIQLSGVLAPSCQSNLRWAKFIMFTSYKEMAVYSWEFPYHLIGINLASSKIDWSQNARHLVSVRSQNYEKHCMQSTCSNENSGYGPLINPLPLSPLSSLSLSLSSLWTSHLFGEFNIMKIWLHVTSSGSTWMWGSWGIAVSIVPVNMAVTWERSIFRRAAEIVDTIFFGGSKN